MRMQNVASLPLEVRYQMGEVWAIELSGRPLTKHPAQTSSNSIKYRIIATVSVPIFRSVRLR